MRKTGNPNSSLLRRTQSTMPTSISSTDTTPGGPGRTAEGSPRDGVERLTEALQDAEAQGLHLIRDVPEAQLAEDRSQTFEGADRYIRRVAEAMVTALAFLSAFAWKPQDLLARLLRIEALDKLIETTEELLGLLRQTRTVEMADLIRMCELVVAELQALVDRPLLDNATRGKLTQILRGPLSVWEKRLEKIRKTKEGLAELRAELAEAQAAAERPATPPPPADERTLPQPQPAPRTGRRTPR
jgi:hypothetical protein